MIDNKRILKEANKVIEFPTKDKNHVTTTSMLIFAQHIAEIIRKEELEPLQTELTEIKEKINCVD